LPLSPEPGTHERTVVAVPRGPHIEEQDTATAITIHGMFDALLRILTGSDDAPPAGGNDPSLALAVLLLETARSDDSVAEREQRIIERALARRFELQPFETARLLEAARQGAMRATDLYNSTRIVVQNFSERERVGVIEMLWEVAYSDGAVTGDEDTLIRRVAGLLYVSDFDRGEAKRRARECAPGS
jgi:uncharacterized tellurite resistance protein B-like protein